MGDGTPRYLSLDCDTCGAPRALGIVAVPFLSVNAAYCRICLASNAHPWNVLVAHTACIGGLGTAPWEWRLMVENTCILLERSMERFNLEVEATIREFAHFEPTVLTDSL